MNDPFQNFRAIRPARHCGARVRGSTRHVLVMALALVSFGVGHQWSKLRQNSQPNSADVATANPVEGVGGPTANVALPEEVVEVRDATDLDTAAPVAPRRVEALSRAPLEAPERTTRSEPTPLARELVTSLTKLDFS